MAWAPDSRRLFYVSERDAKSSLVAFDFATRAETILASGVDEFGAPVVSPDSKSIAYVDARRELRVLTTESQQSRVVAVGEFLAGFETTNPIEWSPNSEWIAFLSRGVRGFYNVSVVAAAAEKPGTGQAVSFLANFNTDSIAWSPDGTFLTFATGQRTEPGQLARVDLVLRTPKFREDRFRSLFEQETPKPKPATAPSSEPPADRPLPVRSRDRHRFREPAPAAERRSGWRRRSGSNHQSRRQAAAGHRQRGRPDQSLHLFDRRAGARARGRASVDLDARSQERRAVLSDSKEVYYLDAGRPQSITVEERRVRPLDVTAEIDVDFSREKSVVFQQAWRILNDYFFDAKHNGVDWAGLRNTYGAHVQQARTPDEMRRTMQLMIGELNASHLGFSAPPSQATPPFTGRLGVRFDPMNMRRAAACASPRSCRSVRPR